VRPWRGALRYVKQGFGNGPLPSKGPFWGTWRGGGSLPVTPRDRYRRDLERECFSPCGGPIGGPLRESSFTGA